VLGIVGIYGVSRSGVETVPARIRYSDRARRAASRCSGLVLKEGAKFSVSGIGLGLAGAFVVNAVAGERALWSRPMDPVTYVGVAIVMAAVTMFACYVPARRAMRGRSHGSAKVRVTPENDR